MIEFLKYTSNGEREGEREREGEVGLIATSKV